MRSIPGAKMHRQQSRPTVVRCGCGLELMTLPPGRRVVLICGQVQEFKCECGKTTKVRTASDV